MRIAAVGDVHGRIYFDDFLRSLSKLKSIDLFLLAGDIARHNTISEFKKVVETIEVPIIAVFGNEEWENQKYIDAFPNITFLCEEKTKVDGLEIVGSSGVLDAPTDWQEKNLPFIRQTFDERLKLLEKLLSQDSILLTHYASTYLTLVGENPAFFPKLGSQKLEKLIVEKKVPLSIHAHAHLGKVRATIDQTEIYNVSLPVTKGITVIEV